MLRPGLAALFVPLTFSSLDAGLFYGGFKGGSDPPPCPGSPGLLPTCPASCGCPAGTPGWPGGGGGGAAAVPPTWDPHPGHLAPPAAPGTLVEWVRTVAPRSGIAGTLHPVRRGGKLSAGIRPAARPRAPPPAPGGPPRAPQAGAASSSSAPSSSKELAEKKHFGGEGTVLGTSGCSGVRTPNQEVCTQKQPPISHYPISPMGSFN